MKNRPIDKDFCKQILNCQPDGILLTDDNLEIIYSNESFRRMWSLHDQEIPNAIDRRLVALAADQLENPANFESEIREVLKSRSSFQGELIFHDGRALDCRSEYLGESFGENYRIWIFSDIAARKQAEKIAVERENWRQAIFASMGEGLIAHRIMADGKPGPFEYVNPVWCRNLGYSPAELAQLSPAEIDDPEIAPQVIVEVMAELKTCGSAKFESVQVRKDGSRVPVAVHARVFNFNQQSWIISVLNDITEQKARDKEREELIAALEKTLSEVKSLRGILPICAFCKKIRDDSGFWEQVEVYIHKHSDADFSHSVCPDCMKRHYPEIYNELHREGADRS